MLLLLARMQTNLQCRPVRYRLRLPLWHRHQSAHPYLLENISEKVLQKKKLYHLPSMCDFWGLTTVVTPATVSASDSVYELLDVGDNAGEEEVTLTRDVIESSGSSGGVARPAV